MLHCTHEAAPGTLLFRTWEEACALWAILTRRLPLCALVLMPTHVHVVLPGPRALPALHDALRRYAQWRNHKREESGPVWAYGAQPEPVRATEAHRRRVMRYIHVNACIEGLVSDPLGWPVCSIRDALGFASPPVVPRVRDPLKLHANLASSDKFEDAKRIVLGPLPKRPADAPSASLAEVFAAVSSVTRTPEGAMRHRGSVRDLLVACLSECAAATPRQISEFVEVHSTTLQRILADRDPRTALIRPVLGDARFALLRDGDLRAEPAWRKYRHLH